MAGNKQVVYWTSETWWEWSEIAGSPHGSPRLWSRKEDLRRAGNRDGKAVWDQVGLHIVSTKPSEAPTEGQRALAYTLLAQSLVKHPLKGDEAKDQNHVGVTNVARQR